MRLRVPRLTALLGLAVVLLAFAGCGGSDGESAPPTSPSPSVSASADAEPQPDDATDTATTSTTEAPTGDDRTIVALDETVAIALLSLGIEPDEVLTTLTSETFAAINVELGISTTEFVIAEPSFEVLAGLAPDLIVSIGSPFVTQSIEQYEQVAPTVVVPIDLSWQEQLRILAAAVDAEDRAEEVIAAVDGLQAATVDAIDGAGASGTSVSLLTVRVGNVLAADGAGSTGALLASLGLDRPETQRAAGPNGVPFIFLSEELVSQQDADVLLLAEAAVFDLEPLVTSPVYDELSAVQNGAVHRVVGDAWMVGGTGFAAFWVLDDVLALFVEGDPVATLDDAGELWDIFLDLIG